MAKEEVNATKYFWLKLDRHYFKRHDIKYIKSLPNGFIISHFYLELLAESIDHEGDLRFSEKIPYNNAMLAAITGVDVKIVEYAMALLEELNLLERLEDGTIRMVETEKMLGLGSSTKRVREWREKQKTIKEETIVVAETLHETVVKPKKVATTNKNYNDEMFTQFWEVYPKKVGKDKCFNWFNSRKVSQDFVDDVVLAIHNQKKSEQWSKNGGQYIPNPYTWLNRGGWNDELKYQVPIEQKIKNRWEGFINNE